LLILSLVNVFHDGLRAVLLSGWRRIAHSSARQQLSRRFARRISLQMAADCSFFLSSMAFTTVCVPYCSADGSALLILALVDGFHDGLRAVFLSGRRRIAHSSTRQRLSRRFARRISLQMAADCSFFLSSTAFTTVFTPYFFADGGGLLILSLVNGFHDGLRAVLLCGWQRIAHSCTRRRLSRRIARCISQRMAADCSFFLSSTAFTTVFAPYFSADGGGLLILSLVNGFHDGLCAVLLCGWQRIAHSCTRRRLSRRFARRISQRTAADCSFFLSSTAFTTVFAPYFSADGGGLLILSVVNGFHDGLRAVLLSGLQRIAHTSARQRLSQPFACHIAPRMAAYCSFFHSSTAFTTVCAPCCPADGIGLLILALVNGFHDGLRAVLLRGWQRIAHTSARQRLSQRFARRIAQRMAADCSYFRSSKAFTTVFTPYCSADGCGLLILPLVNGFHDGLRAVLSHRWQRIAHSFSRQRPSRRFSRRISLRMAADCSFFLLSTAFTTVCVPYCSADGSALLILALVDGFHDGLRAVFLSGRRRIAHSFSCQRLSRWFARRIAQRMAAHCSFFRSSTAFTTVFAPYCSADGSGLPILPLVTAFHDGLRAVLPRGWQRIAHCCTRRRLSRRFARSISQRMAADCSFFLSSMAFTTFFAPYCSSDRSLDRLFFRSYAALPTVCMPYGSTEGKCYTWTFWSRARS